MSKFDDFPPRFAVCIKNTDYPASLELHKIYRILPDDEAANDGDVRVVDESGVGHLYHADYFVVIDVPKTVEHPILCQACRDGPPNQRLQRLGGERGSSHVIGRPRVGARSPTRRRTVGR